MNRYLLCFAALQFAMCSAFAGVAKVNWQDSDHYADIRPTNETQAGFQSRVFKEFENMFDKMAKKLPDGYKLQVNVTDLDLAGEVWPMHRAAGRDIRIVRDIDWPRISFTYVLKDSQDKEVASGKEDLADMNFRARPNIRSGMDGFGYEENMLNDWFSAKQRNKEFPLR